MEEQMRKHRCRQLTNYKRLSKGGQLSEINTGRNKMRGRIQQANIMSKGKNNLKH